MRLLLLILVASLSLLGQRARVPSDWQAAMNRIRPESVRGHVSFLASDLLEGRATPSRGLDIAAEYIASNFRRAGLEPVAGESYFQRLGLRQVTPDSVSVECLIYSGGTVQRVSGIAYSRDGIDIDREPVLMTASASVAAPEAVIVYRHTAATGGGSGPELIKQIAGNGAKLTIVVDPEGALARVVGRSRVFAPAREASLPKQRWLFVPSFPGDLPADARVSVKAAPTEVTDSTSRNVAGILRGSDPELSDTYIVVSAHYDHVGMAGFGSGDRIYNGANDDASGVAGVLEMAEALSRLPERPRRSVIFAAFAGEESGLLGAREFVRNPPVPLGKIVANINLEHLGRPDADGVDNVRKANVTGFTFSSVGQQLADAGRLAGFAITRNEKYSDDFFNASDNAAFAQKGIPAHTVSNGYLFPEYHQPGDHWEKIDCENLAGLARAVALGVLTMADDVRVPQWNETNEKTSKYREAAKELAR